MISISSTTGGQERRQEVLIEVKATPLCRLYLRVALALLRRAYPGFFRDGTRPDAFVLVALDENSDWPSESGTIFHQNRNGRATRGIVIA